MNINYMQRHQASRNIDFDEDEEDEDDSLSSLGEPRDRIKRTAYLDRGGRAGSGGSNAQQDASATHSAHPNTIQVKLNEGYFSNERKAFVGALANCRQKLASLQMFNPAKNQASRERAEQEWTDKEKYTLDSLNEIRGPQDEKFQWSRPEDGRKVWDSKLQYFLAITSYSIGLGNVIRFPILVQKNGGLAFIILFVIMLIVEGIPLFYLELAVGQRMRKAAISCWNLVSPFSAGIGLASCMVSFIIGLYYNTMVAWTLLYLWGSATSSWLPFSQCPEERTAPRGSHNRSAATSAETECQHYWYRQVLNTSEDVGSWGDFNWPVFFALLFAWLISYACLAKGLTSSKRVVYVASTFPYVILTIFFFKALNLEGMSDGICYLFKPEWSNLADPYVWLQAAAQVFFSLGLGFGGLIALSSYNQVNNDCYKDAVKVSLINFCTSIYAGIVIFAILGYKSHNSHDKCLAEREQMIDYYLSDYNLKVIDYGAAFDNVAKEKGEEIARHNMSLKDLEGSGNDYYDSNDAIASIRSLDKQLDSISDKGSFDYGDKDTEFIIDASSLINRNDLDRIIENIPNLPKCSIKSELEKATQGTGLVFVVIAEALSEFKDAKMWSLIFFLMLLTLGLDSQFGNLEGLLSSIADLNFANSLRRPWITGLICGLSLVISVVMFAHGAGSYMFAIFDEYAGSFSLVLIALFELIAISYIYGLGRFCDDCELMTGKRPPFIILLSWRYISPILLLVVTCATIREFSVSIDYEAWVNGHLATKVWPTWCIVFGAALICACVIWIPAIALLKIMRINLIPEESLQQCWFPIEELREFHNIQEEHKITKLERVLFGFRSDDD